MLCALYAPPDASADEDLDDLMGGFDDDFDASEIEMPDDEIPPWLAALPFGEVIHERVDLSGSIAAGATYNYLNKRVRHGDEPDRFTKYNGLSRLDLDGFLQLDVELPGDWLVRAEALGWYDFVYRINGRGRYGGEVLDVYEWQVDSGEVYASGPVVDKLDLTVGRKIVNWGRSDTFRVVDVVNALDEKEPGLVDIEDLRRPVTMAKADVQSGPWSAQFLVIPEFRYSRLPPPGSDFALSAPGFEEALGFLVLNGVPINGSFGIPNVSIRDRSDFQETPGIAGKVDGRFSGWDLSLYGSYVDENRRVLDVDVTSTGNVLLRQEANRFGMIGAAGNITRGAWLFKLESAFKAGIHTLRIRQTPPPTPPPDPVGALAFVPYTEDKNLIETMVGVEYYGPDSLTIALEIVNRNILDYPSRPNENRVFEQTAFETALRVTRPFFRERLEVTLLGLILGQRAQNGGLFRASAEFELTDSWKVDGGVLMFFGTDNQGLAEYDKNDRLFAEIKYSF